MNFGDEEKISLADKILDGYFRKNFGSMSKSDFETLIFSEYINHCIKNHEKYDDYTLSKQLGITQSRIRALKERKELKYPSEDLNWEDSFADAVTNAKYDKSDHYIKLIIEDVNVMNEIRHYIEQRGWYDECSLNKKLLKISLDCFVEICLKDVNENLVFSDDAKKNMKKLLDSENEIKAFFDDFSKEGLKAFMGRSVKTLLSEVVSILPISGFGGVALKTLASIIEKS